MLMPDFYLQTAAIALIIGYFLGNFQSAVLFSHAFLKDDVRLHGSGNPGATNMTRTFGTKWGVLTFFADAAKCVIAVLLGRWMGRSWLLFPQNAALSAAVTGYFAGTGAIIGHCWPVLYRFKGGKGSACNFAFMFIAFWQGGLVTAALAVIVYCFSKKISLVSIVAAVFFTVLSVVERDIRPWLFCFSAVNAAALLIRHKDNIRRLLAGTESTIDY